MIKEGDLILLSKRNDHMEEDKVGVLIEIIYEKEFKDLLPDGISGWLCLVDGEVGVFLRPYWEARKCRS